MNLQELIELAILDAMGLLDEDERDLFESAYRAASPAVQAQVRREQTRLARIEALLPNVTPPAGLRAAVIEAVRREILTSQLDPEVAGTIVPEMIKSRGVSPLWRAASVGLAAAAVIMAFATIMIQSGYKELTRALQDDSLLAAIQKQAEGSVRDMIFNRDTQRVVFHPVAAGFKGEASVFLSPDWEKARFFFEGIKTPDGQPLRLAIVDADDNVVSVLAEITSEGKLEHKAVELRPNVKTRLAIFSPDRNGKKGEIVERGEIPG
jgi:anti-sigma-K factor RskA